VYAKKELHQPNAASYSATNRPLEKISTYYIMLNLYNKYNTFLHKSVSVIEIITYTIAIVIITRSIAMSVYIYVSELDDFQKSYNDSRIMLGQSISLALTFILCIEVLKVFYIKTYQQLVIVVVLTLLKLTIGYYLENEISIAIKENAMNSAY
jgi:uncharacterized membrane protein